MRHHFQQQQHHGEEVEEENINADADDDGQSVVNSEFSRIGDGATDNNRQQPHHQQLTVEEELMNNNGNGQNFGGGGNAFYGSLGGSLLNMSMGTSAAGTDDYQKMYSALMKKIKALETENKKREKEQFTAKEIIEMVKELKQKQKKKLKAFKAEMDVAAAAAAPLGQQQQQQSNPPAASADELRLLVQNLAALKTEVADLKTQNGQLVEKLANQEKMRVQLEDGLAYQSDEIEKQRLHMKTVLAQIRDLILAQDGHGGNLWEEQLNTIVNQSTHLWEHHRGEVCYVRSDNRWNDAVGKCGADLAVTIDKLTVTKEKTNMANATIRAMSPFKAATRAQLVQQRCRRASYFEATLKNFSSSGNQAFIGLSGPAFPLIAGDKCVGGDGMRSSFAVHFCHPNTDNYFYECGNRISGYLPSVNWTIGDVFGIGLLQLANGQRQLFVTKNGAIFAKPRLLPTDTDSELYPTVTLQGQGTSVEANFGTDPAKPFRYDLRTHPGLDN